MRSSLSLVSLLLLTVACKSKPAEAPDAPVELTTDAVPVPVEPEATTPTTPAEVQPAVETEASVPAAVPATEPEVEAAK